METCHTKKCGKPVSTKVHVRDNFHVNLCTDCTPKFAAALHQKREEAKIGGQVAGIDTNRTFDNILRRVFGRAYDRIDPAARAQASQFFHAPATNNVSVVGWFERVARDLVKYAVAKKASSEDAVDDVAKQLDEAPGNLEKLVVSSFSGSERNVPLATKAKERGAGAKELSKAYISAATKMIDADGSASTRLDFLKASDNMSFAVEQWAGDNQASAAAVSCAMDSLQEAVVGYVGGLSNVDAAGADFLQVGPKKVQTAGIAAGQAVARIVPPNTHCDKWGAACATKKK